MNNAVSREEVRSVIDDKLDAVEARQDTKIAEVSGKLDLMFAEIKHQSGAFADLKSDVGELRTEVREDYKGTRTTIIVTAIGSVLAIVALLYTSQANLLSAFQTGLTAVTASSKPATP